MEDIITFLSENRPFSTLPAAELENLAKQLSRVVYENNEIVYHQHRTKIQGLDIIYKGKYETFFYNSEGLKEAVHVLSEGDSYGAFSILLNKQKSISSVMVEKGTIVYRLPAAAFLKLSKNYEPFYQYFLTHFGREMLNDKYATYVTTPSADIETLSFDRYFVRRINTLNPRPLIKCDPNTPSFMAARIMEENRFSCLFVEDPHQGITGYITDIILRNKIVGEERHSHTPVSHIMEGPIFRINSRSFVYEAVLMMFRHKIRYLIVEEDGHDTGVISRSRLLSDQSESPFIFIQSVRNALTVEELAEKWQEVPEVVYQLLTRGVKSELVNQIITNVSDTIAQKVIEGVIEEIGAPPAKFVFMALGSEGRREQTLKTDQDNAIIYEDKANEFREKTRKYFLHFAELVSERLDRIGFTFCTGGLMAKNPKWTHSLSHWKRNYNEWIDKVNPQSVMNFSTFFDCRYIFGEKDLITQLQDHIVEKLEDPGDYFFIQLADNALQYEPPLTFFKSIRTISKGKQQVFNIKKAMTPIVDLVRVYSLKNKIVLTNTGDRLVALKDQKIFSEEEFHELIQSYYYLMGMRLRYQSQSIIFDNDEPHNDVGIKTLTKIEIVTVKEIFKVIEKFQQRIKVEFKRQLF